MSVWGHHVSAKVVVAATLVLALGALGVALTRPAPREITLVAKGMAFYLEGGDLPNPTITLRAGERVRIVLKNQDRGILHDVAIPAVGAALDPIGWNETSSVTFDVPAAPGSYEYRCRPHMMMMRGRIDVE